MRVSDATLYGSLIFYLQQERVKQAQTQLQLSSGKQINSPSDNPVGFAKVLDYRTLLATVDQRTQNLSLASSQLNEQDSTLTSVSNVLGQVKALAVGAANVTNGPTERQAFAENLKGLIGQLLDSANQKLGDRALFTGSTTRGRLTGTTIASPSTGAPVTVSAGVNNTLTVAVDGIVSGAITLTVGSYSTGASLASQVEAQINADPTLAAAGKAVTVTFDTDHLVVISNTNGPSSGVTVTGGLARGTLGLAGGTVSDGAAPFSLGVQTAGGARNTGGAVISPGEVINPAALTLNDYLLKFTSSSVFSLYNVNSPVATTAAAANTGGGLIVKSVVNDTSQVTLDNYQVRLKNRYTVTTGSNDGIQFDPGTGAVTATLAAGTYTGAQLATQVKAALEAVSGGTTYTVGFNETTGKFSITNDIANGTALSLLYSNNASTAKTLLGSTGGDQTGIAAGNTATSDVDTTGAAGVTRQTNVFDTTLSTNVFNITSANNTLIVNDTAGGAGADTTITLTPGSYTGAQLATELAAQLNAGRAPANPTAYTVAYGSVTPQRFTLNDPAGNANSLILKFGDSRSTAAQILGSTPVTVTETVGASATTLNSDAGNTNYVSEGNIDFDGLQVGIQDGGIAARNGDVFAVTQQAVKLSTQTYTSKSPISFDGVQFSIDGAGGSAPAANDVFRVLSTNQYKGDSAVATAEVGDNLTAQTLVNGNTVFGGSNGGTNIFAALQSLETALLSNNVDGIQAANAQVDLAVNQVLAAQGTVGARENRLSGVQDGLSAFKLDVQTLLSGTEDTDITKAASDLAIQQVALQAASQSAVRLLQSSLLNYLQ